MSDAVRRRKLTFAAFDEDSYPIPIDRKSCSLLGPTALVVQALMGLFVILSLVYKRHRETNKRPWRIWLYDVSKQVVGQAFVHSLNLLISDIGADHSPEVQGACVYYFFNILIDTTFGVALIYGLLRLVNHILIVRCRLSGFQSGQYGSPPRFACWAKQAVVYVSVLTSMKLVVVGIFATFPGIVQMGKFLLSWLGSDPNVQVIFVMGFFPIIMNVIQFWVIDTIVKGNPHSAGSGSSEAREPLFSSPDIDERCGESDSEAQETVSTPKDEELSVRTPYSSPESSIRSR